MLELQDYDRCREIGEISSMLRVAYYQSHQGKREVYNTPYGGIMTESIGAWPEFILRGTFCKRSSKGLCSPCFYSRFPLTSDTREEYHEMIERQVKHVIENFKALIVDKQYGDYPQASSEVGLVLTPTGSFFDSNEFPVGIRISMERAILNASKELKVTVKLHIESHCEDFLLYNTLDDNNREELELLRRLNTHVVFGFESLNEYARNVLYNKGLDIYDFEGAVKKAKEVGLIPGAFVFAGLFAYNDVQTHNDVLSTVDYLITQNVFPVIMFQNDQPYTITDVLLKNNKISLLEPFTLEWIVADVLDRVSQANLYWLIADPIGGPPEPDCHIFKNPNITSGQCAEEIYNDLVKLRKSRNTQGFIEKFNRMKDKLSWQEYLDFREQLPTSLDFTRKITDKLLGDCRQSAQMYLDLVEVIR